jgi:BirA family biotin operon repressor/biotin-[acetyl-CoA-carboxylase] ligase
MTLGELLSALGQPEGVSGNALAARFGVTRAAVWKRIAQLRAAGLQIDAQSGRGYRLAQPLDLLDACAIRTQLSPAVQDMLAALRIETELDSTSSALVRDAHAGAASGSVCLAEHQTAGRGRRGRHWQSPIAAHCYLSVLWRFDAGLGALGGLSIAVGVALAEAARALGARHAGLKWPNDLVCEHAKLGGILIDVGGDWAGPCFAVIGIGLNVRMPPTSATAIEQPWTDLAHCVEALPSRSAVAAAVIERLLPALQLFAQDGLAPFMARFAAFDALDGRAIGVHDGSGAWDGVADGIEPDGRLRVIDAAGIVHRLSAAEVSVRRTIGA